jgi:hypothetical protein
MDDVNKGKMRRKTPTKGDMGCVWPKGKQVVSGNDKKQRFVITGFVQKIHAGKMYKIQKRVPQCNECPRGGKVAGKLDEGWGPHWRVSV